MNLSEELEYPAGGDNPQHGSHNHGSKNGPARQRRRTRRAAACEAGKAVSYSEKETGEDKVDDIAKKANCDESSITENVVEDLVDEFCSDVEYLKEIEETSELFKLTYKCLSQESPKSESETLEDIKRNLTYTFNHYKVKSEENIYKVVKFEKFVSPAQKFYVAKM